MGIDHREEDYPDRAWMYLLVLDAEALVLLLQVLHLPLQLADVRLLARAGPRGGLAVLDHALLAAVRGPGPGGGGGAQAHLALERAVGRAGAEGRGARVEAVGEEGRGGRGRIAEARAAGEAHVVVDAVRGVHAGGVVGRGAVGGGEEVEVVGVEAELRGDEAAGRGRHAGGLRRGRARAAGVGPYVLVVVHVHGRHRSRWRALLWLCLIWARSGAPQSRVVGRALLVAARPGESSLCHCCV